MSNNMAKIAEARKTVEQLKLEVNIDRMKVLGRAGEEGRGLRGWSLDWSDLGVEPGARVERSPSERDWTPRIGGGGWGAAGQGGWTERGRGLRAGAGNRRGLDTGAEPDGGGPD